MIGSSRAGSRSGRAERDVVRTWAARLTATATLLCGVASTTPCEAQLRIIPQERVQQAANPTLCNPTAMALEGDGKVEFGTIAEDSGAWRGSIAWRNNHTEPIAIVRLQSTCSCLAGEFSPRSVGAAEQATIELTFHPAGRVGQVEQRIFVYTTLSDSQPTAIIRLSGRVESSADQATLYPHSLGTLRMRQGSIIAPDKEGTERIQTIAVYNSGSTPLKLEADKMLSPKGFDLRTEPAILPPKSSGEMVVTIPDEWQGVPRLYITGLGLPPRKSYIPIAQQP